MTNNAYASPLKQHECFLNHLNSASGIKSDFHSVQQLILKNTLLNAKKEKKRKGKSNSSGNIFPANST